MSKTYLLLILIALISSISIAYEKAPEDGQMLGVNGGYGAYGMLFSPGCSEPGVQKFTMFDYYFVNLHYAKRWTNWQAEGSLTAYQDIERWHIYPYDDHYSGPVATEKMMSFTYYLGHTWTYLHRNVEVSFGGGVALPMLHEYGGDIKEKTNLGWSMPSPLYPILNLKVGDMNIAYLGLALNSFDQGMHASKAWIGGYPHKKIHLFAGGGMYQPNLTNFFGGGNYPGVFAGAEGWVHDRVLLTGTFSYIFVSLDEPLVDPSNGISFNLGVAFTF